MDLWQMLYREITRQAQMAQHKGQKEIWKLLCLQILNRALIKNKMLVHAYQMCFSFKSNKMKTHLALNIIADNPHCAIVDNLNVYAILRKIF